MEAENFNKQPKRRNQNPYLDGFQRLEKFLPEMV
jgi:hypothetical protein